MNQAKTAEPKRKIPSDFRTTGPAEDIVDIISYAGDIAYYLEEVPLFRDLQEIKSTYENSNDQKDTLEQSRTPNMTPEETKQLGAEAETGRGKQELNSLQQPRQNSKRQNKDNLIGAEKDNNTDLKKLPEGSQRMEEVPKKENWSYTGVLKAVGIVAAGVCLVGAGYGVCRYFNFL